MRIRRYLLCAFMAVLVLLLPGPAYSSKGFEKIFLRGARHRGFHRFVISLSGETLYRVVKRGRAIRVILIDVRGRQAGTARLKTGFFSIKDVKTGPGAQGPLTTITLGLRQEARIRQRVLHHPYRIVLDMYPRASKGAVASRGGQKKYEGRERKKKKGRDDTAGRKRKIARASDHGLGSVKGPDQGIGKKKKTITPAGQGKAAARKVETHRTAGKVRQRGLSILANTGWRRLYRDSAVEHLKAVMEQAKDRSGPEFIGLFMPSEPGHRKEERRGSVDLEEYVISLEEEGRSASAATLGALLAMLRAELDEEGLLQVIYRTGENEFTPLARFFIASRYETEGLYTEAGAFYAMVYESKTKEHLRGAAALGRARTLFLGGRAGPSIVWFRRALDLGEREALPWLAGVLVMRGGYEEAAGVYERLGKTTNPFALMGLGEIAMKRGDYEAAAASFRELAGHFRDKDEFLHSFFTMRLADALLGLGDWKDALQAYSSVRKTSRGEGRIMATMALGDFYSGQGAKPLLAMVMYREVSVSSSMVAGDGRLRLAAVLEGQGEHARAMETLEAFFSGNIPPKSVGLIRFWRSKIAYRWITELYGKKKWFDLLEVNYRYGDLITLVKRARASLMVGEAMLRTGLTPDGVLALKRAENLGTPDVKEEALFLLVSYYLGQRDAGAAGRLLEDLRALSPYLATTARWRGLYLRTRYIAGDYEEVIRLGRGSRDGPLLLLVGRSCSALGRWDQALGAFRAARAWFRKKKDSKGLMKAVMGYGESLFGKGDYRGAARVYEALLPGSGGGGIAGAGLNWARYRLSLSYARSGRGPKALGIIRDLRKKDRDLALWAETLAGQGAGG